MAVFRTIALPTSGESPLPGNKKPPGFKGQGERAGGPLTWDWYAVFVDSDGKVMSGGSVTVQWYAVEVGAGGTYTTPTVGVPVAATGLQVKRKGFGAGMWPWCTVSAATAPNVPSKAIDITIGSAADGVYTVDVEGYGSNPAATFEAAAVSLDDIRDGLLGTFSHPDLYAVARGEGVFRVEAFSAGVDFVLALTSPEDDMTQALAQALVAPAATLEIRTTGSAAVEVDDQVIVDALADLDVETAVSDAITSACAPGGAIRTLVRPDGGGAMTTFVNGDDIGSGAAAYEFYPPVPNMKIWLQHLYVETDKPIEWSVRDTSNITSIGPFAADAGEPGKITTGAGGFRTFRANQNEGLELVVSDRTAEVKVSFYAVATDDD